MSEPNKIDKPNKIDDNLLGETEEEALSDTSFITNIKIDISGSPDKNASKDKKNLSSKETSNIPKENSFIANSNSPFGSSKASSRTTTLALDPRPYKKRERVYTTIIIVLAVTLVAQSGLLWAMQLSSNKEKDINSKINKTLGNVIISGAKLNQRYLRFIADTIMRRYIGISVTLEPKNEREALAEFTQGKVNLIQLTEALTEEEKKQIEKVTGKQVELLYTQTFPLGIYINEDSLLNEVSLEQLRKIYLSEISKEDNENLKVVPIVFQDNESLDKIFNQKVMRMSLPKAKEVRVLEDFQTRQSFLNYGEVHKFVFGRKLLKLKLNENTEGVAPMEGDKLNVNYPIIYKTYWYFFDLPKDFSSMFVEELKKQDGLK
jgi:flagellar basal body-associated protein FliL